MRQPSPLAPPFPGMIYVPGGTFLMGSDRHYPEEAPAHRVTVDGFWMDRAPVTNAEFARFVEETGYVTEAERPPDPRAYPGIPPEMIHPGSLVFVPPSRPVGLDDFRRWWRFEPGADWRHPLGAGSSIDDLMDHPVVHVTFGDALAYARWAGKDLPTEAEWERAARGGLEGAEYAWGDELEPGGRPMANVWQGEFPWQNLLRDGWLRTSPVGAFPPNGFGLVDMIGNVWEWTSDGYRPSHPSEAGKACCIPRNPRGAADAESLDPFVPIPRKVIKGGSHLCAPNYCRRYRPAARQPETVDTSSCHLGFRCVVRAPTAPDARARPESGS